MRCEETTPYLAGMAGGDLRSETADAVERHLAGCRSCRTEADRYARVGRALAAIRLQEVEPPPYLVEAVLESLSERRRIGPVPAAAPADILRSLRENKDVAARAAGVVLVAAGAIWALRRAARPGRAGPVPAA